jgi:hypothetical protein
MASLAKLKFTWSMSNKESKLLYRIPVMLRPQQCCKIASSRINFDTMFFPILGFQKVAFNEY